ncbi:IS110 family transposase [Pseudovibrio ascidiaceicola]|uniref:IS110 family transposase n=1 Tax=Pseudovibrio ascidiaceicola TaxID=285279 RepID=UPI003D3608B5
METIFVGLDVSKDETAICVRTSSGAIVSSFKVATDPQAIQGSLKRWHDTLNCVVLETGRMTNWLYSELKARGLPVVCVDARQAHAVLSQMHNKTDENDAALLSELARTGFYREVMVKSRVAQHRRALLKARQAALKTRINLENTIRGLLASFGVRLPKQISGYEQRIEAILVDYPALTSILLPLMKLRTQALSQAAKLSGEVNRQARADITCRRLMTIPGVGVISALTFVATVDAPDRFKKSRSGGAYAGLTSRRYQSGQIDIGGRISHRGDTLLRTVLYEAANSLLCRAKSGKGVELQTWARTLKARTSHKKAVVALARKLAVLMHAIWKKGTEFETKVA